MKRKYSEALVFSFIGISIFIAIMLRPLTSLDELWQYSFGRNIAKGLVPYRDTTMIVPPFSMCLSGLFIKIMGEELYVCRLLGVIICSISSFLWYKILLLKYEKWFAFCMTVYLCILYAGDFTYDYNYLNMCMQILLIFLYLNKWRANSLFWKTKWVDIFLGLCTGLTIITKQTTGLCICLVSVLLFFGIWRKESISKRIIFIIATLFPGIVFFLWLILTNTWNDFIFYAVKGISNFSNKVTLIDFLFHSDLVDMGMGVVCLIVFCCVLYRCFTEQERQNKIEWIILTSMFGAGVIVAYPITDNAHVMIAAFSLFLCGVWLIPIKLTSEVNGKQKKFLIGFSVFIAIFMSFYRSGDEEATWCELKHMQHVLFKCKMEEVVQNINSYMEKLDTDKIYFIDAAAVLYKIPMDMYAKDYDLCLYGHWGPRVPQEVVADLQDQEGYIFLLKEEYVLNWQVPVEAVEYVRHNFTKIDEIEHFDVYTCEN